MKILNWLRRCFAAFLLVMQVPAMRRIRLRVFTNSDKVLILGGRERPLPEKRLLFSAMSLIVAIVHPSLISTSVYSKKIVKRNKILLNFMFATILARSPVDYRP